MPESPPVFDTAEEATDWARRHGWVYRGGTIVATLEDSGRFIPMHIYDPKENTCT